MAVDLIRRTFGRARRSLVPWSVLFELTRKCNLACVHCYALPEAGRVELSSERIYQLLDELREAGTLTVTFSGGDFTVRKDWMDIVRAAAERNFSIQLFSNGVLLDDERAAELATLPISFVGISMYGGTPETHDAITQKTGSFVRAMANIQMLHDAGLHVVVKFIGMSDNIHEIDLLQDRCDALGITFRVDLNMSGRDNGDRSPIGRAISDEELEHVFPNLPELPGLIDVDPDDLADFKCGMGTTFVSINAYGDVFPCVQVPVPAGNVTDQPFADIYRGAGMEQFREYPLRSTDEMGECLTCSFRDSCSRCPGAGFRETGSLYGPYRQACRLAVLTKEHALGTKFAPEQLPSLLRDTDFRSEPAESGLEYDSGRSCDACSG